MPIYDEYEDDYSDVMLGEIAVRYTSPRPDREGRENSRTNSSPYFPNSKTSCWGEMFYLVGLVEENDHSFAEVGAKNEILVSESLRGSHDISLENCHRYSVHDSFYNLLEYGLEMLPTE